MRKLYILALFVLASTGMQAQGLEFQYPEVDTDLKNDADGIFTIDEGSFVKSEADTLWNNTDQTLSVVWLREIVSLPDGWNDPQICDKVTCWGPATETKTITLAPGEGGVFYVQASHLEIPGDAHVRISVWAEGDSTALNTSADFYLKAYDATSASIEDVEEAQISLFPNPVRNQMNVRFEEVNQVRTVEIYNLIGQKVEEFVLPLGRTDYVIPMGDLQEGIYFASFLNADGVQVSTRKFSKVN